MALSGGLGVMTLRLALLAIVVALVMLTGTCSGGGSSIAEVQEGSATVFKPSAGTLVALLEIVGLMLGGTFLAEVLSRARREKVIGAVAGTVLFASVMVPAHWLDRVSVSP